jgi:hypothetical protein
MHPPCDHVRTQRCRVHRIPPRVSDDPDTPLWGAGRRGYIPGVLIRSRGISENRKTREAGTWQLACRSLHGGAKVAQSANLCGGADYGAVTGRTAPVSGLNKLMIQSTSLCPEAGCEHWWANISNVARLRKVWSANPSCITASK